MVPYSKIGFIIILYQLPRKKNLDFKILLLVENCPAQPDLSDVDPNVKVEFLPPNTTSLIQPMNQGVIATFKALYKKATFGMMQFKM